MPDYHIRTCHGSRVPHISLFFCEMWDATKVSFWPLHPEPLLIKSSGLPHLAKNQRDVGHPGSVTGPETPPRKCPFQLRIWTALSLSLGFNGQRFPSLSGPSRLRRWLWFWTCGFYDLVTQSLALFCASMFVLLCNLSHQRLRCARIACPAYRTH
jgi:hypothetical protein